MFYTMHVLAVVKLRKAFAQKSIYILHRPTA